ncbi:uncharacterized protein MKK02DRAFT_40625 [Dioszegia hungarica]|uniref:Uncharacterized protein n=1 Tax=Dioszegia hungarica TaxID=4972 RepID=A0AA38LPP5_9TREE|nr:uncharacterized protein MKK02DRAFT_40625 [Dioszegia hungarica]KAI9632322.1 hypothetical protein MKK02DRAFT_40625 [Dioszegia hungarica]
MCHYRSSFHLSSQDPLRTMGASSSKSVRKLPTTTPSRPTPAWAGARTTIPRPEELDAAPPTSPSEHEGSQGSAFTQPKDMSGLGRNRGSALEYGLADQGAEPGSTGKSKPGFSGEKDSEVLRDGRDPQFMSNLSRLGQVRIHDAGRFVETPALAQRTLSSRTSLLTTPTQLPPPGHLTPPLLSSLLDKLKSLPPGGDPAPLYAEYSMDAKTMEGVRRWVNSPSIGEEDVEIKDGERVVELRAVWVDGGDMKGKRIAA